MTNEEKKIELVKRINELAEICSVNGTIGDDPQSTFIGETIKLVLLAASDQSHAELLHSYICKFLDEAMVLNEEKTLTEHLANQTKTLVN